MANNDDFGSKVGELKNTVRNLVDQSTTEVIENTAQRLERVHFAPPVVLQVSTFLRLKNETLLEEIDRLLALPDDQACALAPNEPGKCRDLRLQFISTLVFHYQKLLRLRAGDAEEWDEIDELYIHD